YVRSRLQQSEVVKWYGLVLITGLVGVSGLLLLEWAFQRSLGLQWVGEWRFNVFTPGVAKVVYMGQEYVRPHGTFAHPNIVGGVLAIALSITSWWWLQLKTGKSGDEVEEDRGWEGKIGSKLQRWMADW